MFANKFFFIKKIDLNRAIAISFILHIFVFYSDLFFNGFKLPKKQDITFEAVLLTQKNTTQEKAVPFEEVKKMDTETKIPEPDAVPLNKKKLKKKLYLEIRQLFQKCLKIYLNHRKKFKNQVRTT